jgi:hypothetical protein
VNGPVKLASDIKTTGAQTYNGGVILDAGYAVSDVVTPMTISTVNGDITFGGTLASGNNAFLTKQSLTLKAGGATSKITFNDTVGSLLTKNNGTYDDYKSNEGTSSIYDLKITGSQIVINANITTFSSQIYDGAVLIGDNTTNGTARTLLVEYIDSSGATPIELARIKPTITFSKTIDDSTANTHDLIIKAVSLDGKTSVVTFEGAIGSFTPLKSLTVALGSQNPSGKSLYGDIRPNDYLDGVLIKANITTYDDQNYFTKNKITFNTKLTCIHAGCSVNFFKNNIENTEEKPQPPEKYNPPGGGIVEQGNYMPTMPAVYETADLERFSSKIAREMGDRSDDKVSTGGSISVVFCGAEDDLMDRLRQKCEDI